MGERDVIRLHRPNQVAFAVHKDIAISDDFQQSAEAAGPNQVDEKAVLVFVEPANDGGQLGTVGLKPRGDLLVLRGDRRDAGIELGDLFFAVQDLLAKSDQAQFRLVERSFQHQRVGLGRGQVADQLALRLAVLKPLVGRCGAGRRRSRHRGRGRGGAGRRTAARAWTGRGRRRRYRGVGQDPGRSHQQPEHRGRRPDERFPLQGSPRRQPRDGAWL